MDRNGKRRSYENDGSNFKTLFILSGSVVAIAIIAFIVTFVTYNAKIEQSTKKTIDSSIARAGVNSVSEDSSIGKKVNELANSISSINVKSIKNASEVQKSNTVDTVSSESNLASNEKSNTVGSNIDAEEMSHNVTSNNIMENNNTIETSSNAVASETDIVKEEKKPDPVFDKPIDGEIICDFAKDNLVFSKTLDEWITHLGIDIKAEKTAVVKASADGVVDTIKNDPRYGLTVVIKHDNGFKTVYSSLLTAEFVVEGENVTSGQTIGTVGNNAAFEIAEDPHLHFEMIKNDEKVDPKIYIRF